MKRRASAETASLSLSSHMKRRASAETASAEAAEGATTALRVAIELDEAGDTEYARRCVEHALREAHRAVALARGTWPPHFDEASPADAPPVALVASVGFATLGNLAHDADDLDVARSSLEESLAIWPENAAACCRLADLELQHGSLERANFLYATAAALPPCSKQSAAWYAELCATLRVDAVASASYMLALLHHRTGSFAEAVPHLKRLGVRHRLSPTVWRAVVAAPAPTPPLRPSVPATESVWRFSNAVPPQLLQQLQAAFAPRSPFWRETDFKQRGYFSFWYDVSRPPTNAVETLATLLLPLTGCADRIVGCEWWVHSKAAASRALGHQMHFDTEEGVLHREGAVVHPAVSSVIYLSGSDASDPTVVLDQRFASPHSRGRRLRAWSRRSLVLASLVLASLVLASLVLVSLVLALGARRSPSHDALPRGSLAYPCTGTVTRPPLVGPMSATHPKARSSCFRETGCIVCVRRGPSCRLGRTSAGMSARRLCAGAQRSRGASR